MFERVLDRPLVAPACCKMCNAGSESPRDFWIDTGSLEEFYGAVYYCSECFSELARLVDFLPPADVFELRMQIREQDARIEELQGLINAARGFGFDLITFGNLLQNRTEVAYKNGVRFGRNNPGEEDSSEQDSGEGSLDIPDPRPVRRGKGKLSLSD